MKEKREDRKFVITVALIAYLGMLGLFHVGNIIHLWINPWIYLEGVKFSPWLMLISANAQAWFFKFHYAVWLLFASMVSMLVTTVTVFYFSH